MATLASREPAPVESGPLRDLLPREPGWLAIAAHLDALADDERVRQVLGLRGRRVKALYHAVAGAPAPRIDDLVPATQTGRSVFEGRNSLPLFSRFQKRFAWVDGQLIGHNHQCWAWVTGPGYFVVRPEGEGTEPGEFVFDYELRDPGSLPEGWPAFSRNDRGVARRVFMNLSDHVRRAGEGVLVGRARKAGSDHDVSFFSLVRRSTSPGIAATPKLFAGSIP